MFALVRTVYTMLHPHGPPPCPADWDGSAPAACCRKDGTGADGCVAPGPDVKCCKPPHASGAPP
eukprot:CAMPEP_0206246814 /NCGR_PEP_ID=MMETSP0047_2-20121206/19471_1 /ASSEMBLY_ACC=CAM_ASM_000192 /TAXON_ID=195065 /ORGANISM="Chroomonas mesostigmatica_cf, Strain CCMP1168" /LENGTH=63 /DNA_ID=CAMNT_0053672285 /DNA_START=27 /DNA_END=215 /DNA_ORIENTATION=+